MSGRDLPGLPSIARTEAPPHAERDRESGLDLNATVAGMAKLQGTRMDRGRKRERLPSSVIHELRTPLTSIHGYAQVLQRNLRNDPRATNALSVVVRESTRLSAMLASLSELADLEAGDVVATPVEVEVFQIVDGVADEVTRRDAGAHQIEIHGKGIARCNPTLLSQALLHVLTNATRYSPPGSTISVSIAERDGGVEIVIADQGGGISGADAERVYEPFERGTNAREAGVRGLGLGLFLARESLRHIGGRIDHRSRETGTTFRIRLPGA